MSKKPLRQNHFDKMNANRVIFRAMKLADIPYKNINMNEAAKLVSNHYNLGTGNDKIAAAEAVLRIIGPEIVPSLLRATSTYRPPKTPVEKPRVRGRADSEINERIKEFYASWEWKEARYQVLKARGRLCECCGAGPSTGAVIVVDHVKPLRKYWHLRTDKSNLQVLCNDCNMGKGSWDETDWR